MRSLFDHVKVHENSVRQVKQTSGRTEFSSPTCLCCVNPAFILSFDLQHFLLYLSLSYRNFIPIIIWGQLVAIRGKQYPPLNISFVSNNPIFEPLGFSPEFPFKNFYLQSKSY